MNRHFIGLSLLACVMAPLFVACGEDDENDSPDDISISQGLIEATQRYEDIYPFSDNMAAVIIGDKYGYINDNGKEVIKVELEFFDKDAESGESTIGSFHQGLAPVAKKVGEAKDSLGTPELAYGFINKKGETVVPFQYSEVIGFFDGLWWVKNDSITAYLDSKGKPASYQTPSFASQYDYVGPFYGGLALVKKESPKFQGFVDKDGNVIIDCSKYGLVNHFSNGLAAVTTEEVVGRTDTHVIIGFIDKKGKLVIPIEYRSPYTEVEPEFEKNVFSDGFCLMEEGYLGKDNKWAFKQPAGVTFLTGFSQGLALISKDGHMGFMNRRGDTTFEGLKIEKAQD